MSAKNRDAQLARWLERPPFGARSLATLILASLLLAVSAQRVDIGKLAVELGDTISAALGLREGSQAGDAFARIGAAMWPPVLAERTAVERIENFDRHDLPWLAYLEVARTAEIRVDPETLQISETRHETEYLVEPLGYLLRVGEQILATLEIAFWGTSLAVFLSAPLAYFGAANYAPNRFVYHAARSIISFFRAIPELISALFLVLAFGFGALPGILALGVHSAGFLGKFYAEDIENADEKPQEALTALGASKPKVLITAVFPEVMPQYVAYTLYVLDRNVRMATVIGIVGAGGIGQELKGRYDLFNYGHVCTILIAIFLTVWLLDRLSAHVRARLI